ncbi:NAD(P)/FAD-dependent oxidoreductase [Paenibacillus sp. TRM 82003]|uniref:phytoene desaturase family protein n=1 Tax=Kineococcus sp. TRM81007 TaxID=2925831 RepID=UPI001F5A62D8|nr:NAD(P)/FAD-dependent oxidoreductase [Kineococcus sp. TRM81007]MCI2237040.1 NAD(P)/FAD-dependent oxidoreductase [Kineococcus sp. TRM81007]MCI3926493.1 NAD(P)/FAD-dependent oxidoreductase [Paenibacillus sp. TRM 82003]
MSTDGEVPGEFDAIVVGSGVNGLVAAAELAGAGWSVALLERNPDLGGFTGSAELTAPGFVHDRFSSWHPLFVTGGAYADLGADLHRHGLEYANTEGPITASVADDGRVSLAHRDPGTTAAAFEHPEDRETYLAHLARFGRSASALGGLLGGPVRSPAAVGSLLGLLRGNGPRGSEAWLRDAVTSGRGFVQREFRGGEVDHLWVPWLLHAGLSPDHASGGAMVAVFAATLHAAGMPVVRGGSDRFVEAFAALLRERGATVLTGAEVRRVEVADGRAHGVVLTDGTVLRARRAVLASVSAAALYGGDGLLPPEAVPERVRRDAQHVRWGRAAAQVHVALSRPPAWSDPRLGDVPLVHLSDGSGSTGIACAEADAGLLPRRPTVVVGQQHVLDPSRAPEGAATLWLQLQELPFRPRGDAAGELDTRDGWTAQLAAGYTERVLDRVERHAPGLRGSVLGVETITPVDLQRYNPNAGDGDPYGGSAQLDQSYVWRPVASWGRHRTPVPGLWQIGAATHPGAGLGAGSGHLVATTLLARERRRRSAARVLRRGS